jgi:aconitate hydratase
LAAKPHSPDNVEAVAKIGEIKVDQVAIGSCTNSSYMDMIKVARILKGRTVHPDVSLVIAPGSKQVLTMLAREGALADMVAAGARILESACGPCIGMGQAPSTGAVSLRTFNRNFEGRSGTASAGVYLVSPETAAASAVTGVLTDPRKLGEAPAVTMPDQFVINDNMVLAPVEDPAGVEVVRGPNIKPFPINKEMPVSVEGVALIKVGDNITTDHIMPSNAKLLPYRSNIPYLAEYCLTPCDPEFPKRAKENGGGFIVGGSNYGQGSSREHAALAPLQLGIKGVVAKSFARIHMANLINSGILPMTFVNEGDYDRIANGDVLVLENAREQIKTGNDLVLKNKTANTEIKVKTALSGRQVDIMLAGGLLNYTRAGK